ncbi:hypothetical protein I4U23_015708 [Adineta vaga]|nr:hypothetical protein I4U23_015708 [Adineta vaga]
MGTVCSGTEPSEKFVGVWTNKSNESLTIYPNGLIYYLKQWGGCRTRYKNCAARFDDDSFEFCCCVCCSLHGRLDYEVKSGPRLIVNGTVLTKEPVSSYMEK